MGRRATAPRAGVVTAGDEERQLPHMAGIPWPARPGMVASGARLRTSMGDDTERQPRTHPKGQVDDEISAICAETIPLLRAKAAHEPCD